ncbi:DUF6390 family protein [Rhodococcus sp. NPDC127528]|uniref:DUF6390 family protein n=1 Tax=unclassified Rhodococcus (in: high G+C Gram-positive bacteria) TaxID=192944 RepID=UPI00363AE6EB
MPPPGHRLFARYAYAPNALGYCGPAEGRALEAVACGDGEGTDVPALAAMFSGAWPYQRLVAAMSGIADPLDERVGRAYWTGNELTDRIDRDRFGAEMLAEFTAAAGHYWKHLTPELLPEAAPTHAFHVFGVYPWSRLLDAGVPQPLQVLDSCRIGWGTVTEIRGLDAMVRSRRLEFDGTLHLGQEQDRPSRYRAPSGVFVPDLRAGDQVAVHWDFVCDRLDSEQVERLEHWTRWQLDRTNVRLTREGG